ncbi:HAD-like domain-containing protein [Pelagophyceae sp. CCMP2097]|nr:HAD-like domain-containing protein [Pelagophyceae sp. CCMP2097]
MVALDARLAPKKMVAFDMDGTLLAADHKLTEATKLKVRELSDLGVTVVIASGRSAPALYAHVADLALDAPVAAVCYNGAMCYIFEPNPLNAADASKRKQLLFANALAADASRAVVAFGKKHGLLLQYYSGDSIFVHCITPEHHDFVRRYHELTGARHTLIDDADYQPALQSGDAAKLLFMTDDPDAVVSLVNAAIAAGDLPALTVVRGSPPFFVEILRDDVCKGAGLKQLCDAIDVPLEDTVAFGDGDNDLEFVEMAGVGVAMLNARDIVKQSADRVTEHHHDDDGVAFELEKLQAEGALPRKPN